MNDRMTGTSLDPWNGHYAARTQGMTTSEIRALFAVASRPEVVSLAGGMPNLAALPLDVVGALAGQLITEKGEQALQYGSGQGTPELRELICDVMALEHISAPADDIVVTTGSQQALDLVTRIFIDPGDVIVAEAPSYVGALGVFQAYQASVVHTAMDDDGLIPQALDDTLTQLAAERRTVKFIYTVPNYHNPGGVTLSAERRPQIVDIAQRHGVLILEDNPYGLLGFDNEPAPALRSYAPDDVIYLGSFSKTFAPGLRVGWALAPHAVREKLVLAAESAILCPSAFAQALITSYLENHDWQLQVKSFREMYRERRDAMLKGLEERMPEGTAWTHPSGGFYVWVTLPEGLSSKAMLPRAVTKRVAYVPGSAFFTQPKSGELAGTAHMRLSYCYPTPERITEGLRRLSRVIDEELDVINAFGPRTDSLPIVKGVSAPGPDSQ